MTCDQASRIFLSAYACEPNKGSEPGVGWRWANGLASRVALHVLTRESNRDAIDKAVAGLPAEGPMKLVMFIYHDLSKAWLSLTCRMLSPNFDNLQCLRNPQLPDKTIQPCRRSLTQRTVIRTIRDSSACRNLRSLGVQITYLKPQNNRNQHRKFPLLGALSTFTEKSLRSIH
jgi:hypothetical protein